MNQPYCYVAIQPGRPGFCAYIVENDGAVEPIRFVMEMLKLGHSVKRVPLDEATSGLERYLNAGRVCSSVPAPPIPSWEYN